MVKRSDSNPQTCNNRSRSPLSSKRLSSHDNSAAAVPGNDDASSDASSLAESVFRERKGLERPPPPVEVVAETPNATAASSNCGGGNDSLNSSTASQVQKMLAREYFRAINSLDILYIFLHFTQNYAVKVKNVGNICRLSETMRASHHHTSTNR